MPGDPVVEFTRLIPSAVPPRRADRSAGGYLPSRAIRFCEALTTATSYGYWVFPPLDIQLIWTGEEILWTYGGADGWLPLTSTGSQAAQFPNYASLFDATAPEELRGCSPPFLTAMPEIGGVQIWTGLVARTRPGWSLLVRNPVNLPLTPGFTAWEGIVETDIWTGPLFANARITRTDLPVVLRADTPFLQVQPIPQAAFSDQVLSSHRCTEAADLTGANWAELGQVLLPTRDLETRQGAYAVKVRKRRSSLAAGCPAAGPSPTTSDDAGPAGGAGGDQDGTPARLSPSL